MPTNPLYNQSLDAAVIECGPGGSYTLSECDFRNLKGPLAALGVGPGRLSVTGGAFLPRPGEIFADTAGSRIIVSIDRCQAIAAVDGNRVVLPVWPTWSGWRLGIAANRPSAESTNAEYILIPVGRQGARVITVWSTAAAIPPPTATRGSDTVSIDFSGQRLTGIDATVSTVP